MEVGNWTEDFVSFRVNRELLKPEYEFLLLSTMRRMATYKSERQFERVVFWDPMQKDEAE